LDTRTVNGHTTTSDALWAGVPVISVLGTHFASRVSASLLQAVGLDDLITASMAMYEEIAVNLAANPKKLAALKGRLEKNRLCMPLFDTGRFTRNLERAYDFMWRRHASGKPPQSFNVKDVDKTT
jgi:protein O-GlcNAc transferase